MAKWTISVEVSADGCARGTIPDVRRQQGHFASTRATFTRTRQIDQIKRSTYVHASGLQHGSGQSRDRTGDTRIFSPVLYQLSYLSSGVKNNVLAFRGAYSFRTPLSRTPRSIAWFAWEASDFSGRRPTGWRGPCFHPLDTLRAPGPETVNSPPADFPQL